MLLLTILLELLYFINSKTLQSAIEEPGMTERDQC